MEPPVVSPERSLRELPPPVVQAILAAMALLVVIVAPRPLPPPPAADPVLADTWQNRQAAAAAVAAHRPGAVSFSVLDATGREVASYNARNRVSTASTIKALILVAYLRQPDVADRDLYRGERAAMERMITFSANKDATRLLRAVGWSAVEDLAEDAGIAEEFTPDIDQWGLSRITAGALARFFQQIPSLVPPQHRDFALELFGSIVPEQQWGMPQATPKDWSWHVKAGWITSVVNQVGVFTRGAQEFTVAITIEGEPGTGVGIGAGPEEIPAVRTLQLITGALFGEGDLPEGSGPQYACGMTVGLGAAAYVPPGWAEPANPCAPVISAV